MSTTEKYVFHTRPFKHQLDVLKKSWNKPDFALFLEMGTGKSKILIDNIAELYERGLIDGAMILAPKGVYLNWTDTELPAHMPSRIPATWAAWTSGKRSKEYDKMLKSRGLRIMVMNIEALSQAAGAGKAAEQFLLSNRCMMAIDESTVIKNHKSQRSKWVLSLRRFARYRRIMSGMPVTQSPLDLYSQCAFLNPELLGFSSFYAFKARYAILRPLKVGPKTISTVVGYRDLKELTDKLDRFSIRVRKSECLDLPEKIYERRWVFMSPEQKAAYEQMRKSAILLLGRGEEVTAPLVLTQMLRLHQIACGFVSLDILEDDEQRETVLHTFPNGRMDALMETLEEVSGKVIIWCTYRYNIREIVERIKHEYGDESVVEYHGGTATDVRQEAVKRFETPNDPARFFVGNPSTGGRGITLIQASTVVYYSNDYRLESRLQSEDRAHRIGQTKSVTYIDLVMKNTVDEKIVSALRSKKQIAGELLKDKWEEWI